MLKQHKSDQNEGNYGKMEAHWDGEFLLVAARGGRGDGGQSQVLSSTSSSSSFTTSISISLLACHSLPSWNFFWTTGIGFKYFWVISNHVSTPSHHFFFLSLPYVSYCSIFTFSPAGRVSRLNQFWARPNNWWAGQQSHQITRLLLFFLLFLRSSLTRWYLEGTAYTWTRVV